MGQMGSNHVDQMADRPYIPLSAAPVSQRQSFSPAFYDPSSRSVPPPRSNYYEGSYGQDEAALLAKRKRKTLPNGESESPTSNPASLSNPDSQPDSSKSSSDSKIGLLEQYKLSNTDKIVVSRDVELKAKVTELERHQIGAILEAYKQAIKLVKAHGIPKSSEDINTTINLTELGVRRLIFFFKLISDFRNLDHDLMVKLLKKNMMNLIQIHVRNVSIFKSYF